ncbi:pentapeptide repeat-containing protein [Tolypothrix bouteillei VB521301_2]|uniref:pentapeptide repeat-containing protein n=1 Tax=Tolypothrix bouteillei TaxID=1246981 RepID=UPI000B05D00E
MRAWRKSIGCRWGNEDKRRYKVVLSDRLLKNCEVETTVVLAKNILLCTSAWGHLWASGILMFDNWLKSVLEKKQVLSAGRTLLISATVVVGALTIYKTLYPLEWAGFGPDSNKSVTTKEVINPKDGKIIKLTETTEQFQSGKTFWDWLGLAGTLAIPVILFQFQQNAQRRERKREQTEKEQAEKQAELEKEIAASNLREEALQIYIDRISELLLNKARSLELFNAKADSESNSDNPVRDVARMRTVAVLRRLENDLERQSRILHFLRDAELLEFILKNANLANTNLAGTNFEGTNLTNVNLIGTNLTNVNFAGTHLESANLKGANLANANLESANLKGTNLADSNLESAILKSANLTGVNLERAYLESTNLAAANLESANLNNANLTGANLAGANLTETNLKDTNFKGANLQAANVIKANLIQANLAGAYLERTNFERAYLKDANLSGANLYSANLNGAYLYNANLEGAVLHSANLEYTNFEDANLYNADLSHARLEGAILNEKTILPDRSNYQSHDQLAKFTHPDTSL